MCGLDLAFFKIETLPEHFEVEGELNLNGTPITELPDDLKVGGGLCLSGSKVTKLPSRLVVGKSLDISITQITEIPKDITVGRDLVISHTPIRYLPKGLKVNGNLIARDSALEALPEDLTVLGSVILLGSKIVHIPNNIIVCGSLDLGRTPIQELPDNLIVGEYLAVARTKMAKLPENLTIGGELYVDPSQSTALPESLKVGRGVYQCSIAYSSELVQRGNLSNGTYIPGKCLYADRCLTYVKRKRTFQGYTVYVGRIPGYNVITDGKHYAHCDSLRDGIKDLQFKKIKDRGMKQYEHLTLDSELPAEEMITMYRVITGACRQGTEAFLQNLGTLKEIYTVREAIELTKGQYGAEAFAQFFNSNQGW